MGAPVVSLARRIRLRRGVLVFGVWLLGLGLSACLAPPYETGPAAEIAASAQTFQQSVNGRTLHWVEVGPADSLSVLMLHGTPGRWQAWGDYLNAPALAGLRRIAIDRPGFGNSAAGGVETSLQRQADWLASLYADRGPLLVVGHSLGGSLALRLLRDHPELVRGVVLVAASLDPAAEAPRWFNRVAQWPPVRWLLPEPLARANAEVIALQHELRALWADWTPGATPVVLIQGMEDRLVWPQTADFAEARWPSQTLQVQRLEQAGHFVLWDQPDIVIEAIVQLAMAR